MISLNKNEFVFFILHMMSQLGYFYIHLVIAIICNVFVFSLIIKVSSHMPFMLCFCLLILSVYTLIILALACV